MWKLLKVKNLNFVEIIDILNKKSPPPTTCSNVPFERSYFPLPQ